MKSYEEILEKVKLMENDLKKYLDNWEKEPRLNINGIPMTINEDRIYITITNQIEALKWVLKK